MSIIKDYFEKRNLPYDIIDASTEKLAEAGIRLRGGIPGRANDDWLGWIYDTEFKTFNWSINRKDGVIKCFSAADPDFFSKLEAWLPECVMMWEAEAKKQIV